MPTVKGDIDTTAASADNKVTHKRVEIIKPPSFQASDKGSVPQCAKVMSNFWFACYAVGDKCIYFLETNKNGLKYREKGLRIVMKKFFYGIIALIGLLVALLWTVPHLINWNDYVPFVESEAQKYLGRPLKIKGDVKIVLLPSPHLTIREASLSNPQNFSGDTMAHIQQIDVYLSLGALFTGELKLDRVSLLTPVLQLERSKAGQENWIFPKLKSIDKSGSTTKKASLKSSQTPGFLPHEIIIQSGTISFTENGITQQIDDLYGRFSGASLQGPFNAKGKFVWQEKALKFDLALKAFEDISQLKLTGNLSHKRDKIEFKAVANGKALNCKGQFKSTLESISLPFEKGKLGTNALKVSGVFEGSPREITIKQLDIQTSVLNVKGDATYKLANNQIRASLNAFPGQTSVLFQGKASHKSVQGNFHFQSAEPLSFFKWVRIDPTFIPNKNRNQPLKVKTTVHYQGDNLKLKGFSLNWGELEGPKGQIGLDMKNQTLHLDLQQPRAEKLLAFLKRTNEQSKNLKIGLVRIKGQLGFDQNKNTINTLLDISAQQGKLHAQGDIKNMTTPKPYADLDITVSHPNGTLLLKNWGSTSLPLSWGDIRLGFQLKAESNKVAFENLEGHTALGRQKTSIAGKAKVVFMDGAPAINVDLQLGTLDLEKLFPPVSTRNSPRQKSPKSPSAIWSDVPFSLDLQNSGIRKFEARIGIGTLKRKELVIKDLSLTGGLHKDTIEISSFSGDVFKGKLQGSALFKSGQAPVLNLSASLKNVPYEALFPQDGTIALKSLNKKGLNADCKFSSHGKSPREIVSNLQGQFKVKGEQAALQGIELGGILSAISQLNKGVTGSALSLFESATKRGGQTKLLAVNGLVDFKNGIGTITTADIKSDVGTINMDGTINLVKWLINLKGHLTLKIKDTPKIPVALTGSLSSPQHSIDLGILASYFFKSNAGTAVKNALKKGVGNLFLPGSEVLPVDPTDIITGLFEELTEKKEEDRDPSDRDSQKKAPKKETINPLNLIKEIF